MVRMLCTVASAVRPRSLVKDRADLWRVLLELCPLSEPCIK
jgi:hypothetical protein